MKKINLLEKMNKLVNVYAFCAVLAMIISFVYKYIFINDGVMEYLFDGDCTNPFRAVWQYITEFRGDFRRICINQFEVQQGVPYPPMVYVLASIVSKIIEFDAENVTSNVYKTKLFMFIYNSAIFVSCLKLTKNFLVKNKVVIPQIILIILMTTRAYLSGVRAFNISVLILPLILYFIYNHDDENVIVRETAILSISLASSIRLSPFIFSFLLLYNKKYKSFLKVILYSLILFFIPLVFFENNQNYLSNLKSIIDNFKNYSGNYAWNRVGGLVSIYTFLRYIGVKVTDISVIIPLISKIISLICLLFVFVSSDKLKQNIFMCLCIIFFGTQTFHVANIFIIPFTFTILNNNLDIKTLIIILILLPLFPWMAINKNGLMIHNLVMDFLFISLFIITVIDTLISKYEQSKENLME